MRSGNSRVFKFIGLNQNLCFGVLSVALLILIGACNSGASSSSSSGSIDEQITQLPTDSSPVPTPRQDPEIDPEELDFKKVGFLDTPRNSMASVLLPRGRVMVFGGYDEQGRALSSAEIYRPENESFSRSASMVHISGEVTALTLTDGRVLALGLSSNIASITPLAEIFDPATERFTDIGEMLEGRKKGYTATELLDGTVLITGGVGLDCGPNSWILHSAEIFNPQLNSFSPTGYMQKIRSGHSAVRLPNGQVLITGGDYCFKSGLFGWIHYSQSTAEIYDPNRGTFRSIKNMNSPRSGHTSILLPNGKVFIMSNGSAMGGARSFEIFDPETETFSHTQASSEFGVYSLTLMPNGKIFAQGRESCAVYDPSEGVWHPTSPMNDRRYYSKLIPLSEGQVWVIGGDEENQGSVEMYKIKHSAYESVVR